MTLGDHMSEVGVRTVLCGKTHMAADVAGMWRLGIDPGSGIGNKIAECGFEVFDRLDGSHPDGAHSQAIIIHTLKNWVLRAPIRGSNGQTLPKGMMESCFRAG